jgi:hypothetical protein
MTSIEAYQEWLEEQRIQIAGEWVNLSDIFAGE